MNLKKFASSSICTAVLCTAVTAQETSRKQETSPQQATASAESGKSMSNAMVTAQQIAACLALDNHEEVILAKFAQEKTTNEEVGEFAKMISEEHQSCLKKLSKFAPDASRAGYLSDNQSEQSDSRTDSNLAASGGSDQPSKANTNRSNNQNDSAGGSLASNIDMLQLQREIAQQCIADSKKYLNTKESDEFDKCFVGMQIAKHAAMHTKLVVLERHTSGELQHMVAEGIQATAKHLKAAETLMETLAAQSDKSTE